MRDRSVNSYDLKDARQILSTLVQTPGMSAAEATAVEEGYAYVRLVVPTQPAAVSAPSVAAGPLRSEPSPEPVDAEPRKLANWDECLAWCMSITRAEAAFVVDSQGFIIASRGRVPGHGFEGTGAELVCSVEQLERVDPDAGKLQWVDMDFDKRRIAGFITPPSENDEYYVIGLIAPDPAYYSLKQLINRQIVENLSNMD